MHMPTTTEKLKRQKMVLNPRPQETTGTCFGGYTAEFYDEKNSAVFCNLLCHPIVLFI